MYVCACICVCVCVRSTHAFMAILLMQYNGYMMIIIIIGIYIAPFPFINCSYIAGGLI